MSSNLSSEPLVHPESLEVQGVGAKRKLTKAEFEDVAKRYGNSCGAYQLLYFLGMGLAWGFTAFYMLSEGFILLHHHEKAWSLEVSNQTFTRETYPVRNSLYDLLGNNDLANEDACTNLKACVKTDAKTKFRQRTQIAMFLGIAIGGFFTGKLSEKTGYKKLYMIGFGVFIFITLVTMLLPQLFGIMGADMILYVALPLRFVHGFGWGCITLSAYMIMDEATPMPFKEHMAWAPSFGYQLGYAAWVGLSMVTLDYYYYSALTVAIAVGFLIFGWGLDRSAISLATAKENADVAKAKELLQRMKDINNVPDVKDEANESKGGSEVASCGDETDLGWYRNLGVAILMWVAWAMAFWGTSINKTDNQSFQVDHYIKALFGGLAVFYPMLVYRISDDLRCQMFLGIGPMALASVLTGVFLLVQVKLKADNFMAGKEEFEASNQPALLSAAQMGATIATYLLNFFATATCAMVYVVTPRMFSRSGGTAMGILSMASRFGMLIPVLFTYFHVPEMSYHFILAKLHVDAKQFFIFSVGDDDTARRDAITGYMGTVFTSLLYAVPSILAGGLVFTLPAGIRLSSGGGPNLFKVVAAGVGQGKWRRLLTEAPGYTIGTIILFVVYVVLILYGARSFGFDDHQAGLVKNFNAAANAAKLNG